MTPSPETVVAAQEVVRRVSQARLMALVDELAGFGARPDGGVDRQALTAPDIEARAFLAGRARALGCTVQHDAAGNLFFRRPGRATVAPVATGSHIDTQPAGGRLDGAYGVCAGFEVIAALNDAGVTTHAPIEVVAWSNEEGCRFAPGSLGSQAFVEPEALPQLLDATDAAGVRYGECIERMRLQLHEVVERPVGMALAAFVEAHIEQGPVLEANGLPVGIVSCAQGVRWFRVRAIGEARHAGTTPLAHRRDALRAATGLMTRLYDLAEDLPELRLTVGRIDVEPASINTVPGAATITVDARHIDAALLDRCEAALTDYASARRHGCDVVVERLMALPTTFFDDRVRHSLRSAARMLGHESCDIVSGAFHDAVHLTRHCPTGMIFVPSHRGISHHPAEYTDPASLAAGAQVLAASLIHLAGSPAS